MTVSHGCGVGVQFEFDMSGRVWVVCLRGGAGAGLYAAGWVGCRLTLHKSGFSVNRTYFSSQIIECFM